MSVLVPVMPSTDTCPQRAGIYATAHVPWAFVLSQEEPATKVV